MTSEKLAALRVALAQHEARDSGGPMEVNPRDLGALLDYVAVLERVIMEHDDEYLFGLNDREQGRIK